MNNEKLNALLAELSPEEQQAALLLLGDLAAGDGSKLDSLYKADYRETPVSPETFLDDEYYFNHVGKKMYKKWREHFMRIYYDPTIYHVILTGAIGIGKDYFTEVCLAYELYKIGCLKDPHAYVGLAENTDIVFGLVSITREQAKRVIFTDLKNAIDSSPWFKENFRRDMDKNEIMEFSSPKETDEDVMGKITVVFGAPSNSSVIGQNLITAAIDEANFMEVVKGSKRVRGADKEFNQAKMLYNNIIRRMQSRFLNDGKLPGKLFLLSSRQYPDDFVEKKISELREQAGVYIIEHSLWDIKPEKYSSEYFIVEVGDENYPSRIVPDGEEPRVDAHLTFPPIDFRSQFEEDIDGAIRDIAGIATLSTSTFIKQRNKITEAIDTSLPKILTVDSTDLTSGVVFDELAISKIDKDKLRVIHLDMSSSVDSFGFAMSHIADVMKKVKTVEVSDIHGVTTTKTVPEYLPIFQTDIILEIRPPINGEIQYSDVRALIYQLREYGFSIALITADQYQSKDMLQILEQNGFTTGYLSVDRTLEPYYNFRTALYEGRVKMHRHAKLIEELTYLEEDRKAKKVDHRPNYSKDVSDAVVGSCQGLVSLNISKSIVNSDSPQVMKLFQELGQRKDKDQEQDDFTMECAKIIAASITQMLEGKK